MRKYRISGALLAASIVASPAIFAAADCDLQWSQFLPGGDLNNTAYSSAIFDDGRGPALYVSGEFNSAGGRRVNKVARWDGQAWSAAGEYPDAQYFTSLATLDLGSGPALFATALIELSPNTHTAGILRWDGHEWTRFAPSPNPHTVALAAYDDGTGPALYVAGDFWLGIYIRRWDGQAWQILGQDITDCCVKSLLVAPGPQGEVLYAAGSFTEAGGVPAGLIATWDGTSWAGVGGGLSGSSTAHASVLALYDGMVVAAGRFDDAGGAPANNIAAWDGSTWHALGAGTSGVIESMTAHDGTLVVGGQFGQAGGIAARRIASWDGHSWSPMQTGVPRGASVNTLASFDDGAGAKLYAAGRFEEIGGVKSRNIASWSSEKWSPLRTGFDQQVNSLLVFENALYVGGYFRAFGSQPADYIVRWDGQEWTTLPGMPRLVGSMTAFDDGSGMTLYTGSTGRVMRWRNDLWQPVGGIMTRDSLSGNQPAAIRTLTVFDDGGGPALYVGGSFDRIDGSPAGRVARWTGTDWAPLGTGMNREVFVLSVVDDGTGEALYAGGLFTTAGGISAVHIARWDGHEWSALGAGMATPGCSWCWVFAITYFDDGTGGALYAGGVFEFAGGVPAKNIARWDGSSWEPVGSGISTTAVQGMSVVDDGTGEALYVAASGSVYRWNGHAWREWKVDPVNSWAGPFALFDDGSGPALYLGGSFGAVDGVPSQNLTRLTCTQPVCYADCDGNGVLNVDDFLCFLNNFALAQALPHAQQVEHYANCDGSTSEPVLTVDDFLCFVNAFATGCE